jgi:hypothetical protein
MALSDRNTIILLLDGTWNDADVGDTDTNVVRLRDAIARTLKKRTRAEEGDDSWRYEVSVAKAAEIAADKAKNAGTGVDPTTKVTGLHSHGQEYIVLYQRGVGTGAFDRLGGALFGSGLSDNVRRAYKFLSYFYRPGDSVFVFGFSRGAFTARSLIGYVGAAGLLTRENCTRELEHKAWQYYRTPPEDRLPGAWVELQKSTHPIATVRVACVGVFDTVGALGVPVGILNKLNRDKYSFHNVELSSITDVNLHALAIDEQRLPFQATIWRKPKFKQYHTSTEQVWFSGVHADIGGGYVDVSSRESGAKALDDITFDWMIRRLRHYYPEFPVDEADWVKADKEWAAGPQHNSRTSFYELYPAAHRVIGNHQLSQLGRHAKPVCYDRHSDPIGEMVHVSALMRLGANPRYRPINLCAALDRLDKSYAEPAVPADDESLRIVDWAGRPLDPCKSADRAEAHAILRHARKAVPAVVAGRDAA